MGNYTLLADENCSYSKTPALRDNFRAHIMFNVIANGAITLSDNQAMSSPHVRTMMRRDGVVREMVKQSFISLAVRDEVDAAGLMPLDEVFRAFRAEGKLPKGFTELDESPEIAFLQNHAHKIGWSYGPVRETFTTDCKAIIFDQMTRLVGSHQIEAVRNIIAAEEERDGGGLGRVFLRDRLPKVLSRHRVMPKAQAEQLLATWTDAVYLSNLPKTIGLNPIYADEHRESFRILRGYDYETTPFGDEYDLRPRLDAKHFTHGLNQLDIDDVRKIQESDAYRLFTHLSQAEDKVSTFDDLFVAHGELNRVIEDHIIDRFRNLMRHSPAPDPRKQRRQYATAFENGTAVIMDILQIAQLGPSIPGVLASLVVDAIRGKIDRPRHHVDAARHDLEKARLRQYLDKRGKAGTMSFEEDIAQTRSFAKEIIVR